MSEAGLRVSSELERQIVAKLARHPGWTVDELADAAGFPAAAVRLVLRDLSERGRALQSLTGCEAGRWRLASHDGTRS